MQRFTKCIAVNILLVTICLFSMIPVLGAEAITGVSLHVSANIYTSLKKGDEQLSVGSSSSHPDYEISSYGFLNEGDFWQFNDRPRLEIQLKAKKDCYFSNLTKDDITITSKDAVLETIQKQGNEIITLVLVFPKLSQVAGKPVNLRWTADGRAVWDGIPNTSSYDIRLYRDGRLVLDLHNTRDPWFNLAYKMSVPGTYTYQVRSHHYTNSAVMSEFAVSAAYEIDAQLANAIKSKQIGWKQDQNGWWYQTVDGNYLKDGWADLDGHYYYFNEEGYLLVNTTTPDGYLVDENGSWVE